MRTKTLLATKSITILGAGNIGTAIARRLVNAALLLARGLHPEREIDRQNLKTTNNQTKEMEQHGHRNPGSHQIIW